MLDWLFRYGRWPTARDWARATLNHPTQKTVADRFGSWSKGKRAAGWRPKQEAESGL